MNLVRKNVNKTQKSAERQTYQTVFCEDDLKVTFFRIKYLGVKIHIAYYIPYTEDRNAKELRFFIVQTPLQ